MSRHRLASFQRWLDDQSRELTPPLAKGDLRPEVLHLAAETVAYYCRARHNDWSEEWIREHLATLELGTYHNWLNDLVRLCRSHHHGYDELAGPAFNPRCVGAPSAVLHLRYLACALRVADVLDFDPERTPDVILRHREIPPESLIYWWKDKELSIHRDGPRYVVHARPSGARIQKALEVTLAQLDAELSLTRRLADETHFEKCPGLQANLPHHWNLHPVAHRDIAPAQRKSSPGC